MPPALCAAVPPSAWGAGGPDGFALGMGIAAQVKGVVGELIYSPLSWRTAFPHKESMRRIKRCSSTGILLGDSCPEGWHQIQVTSEQVLEFRRIKRSLPALPYTPWWHILEPSVTEEQKLDPGSCLVLPSISAKQAFWTGCPCSTMRIMEITADLLSSDASEPNGFHLNVEQICQCAVVTNAQSLPVLCLCSQMFARKSSIT